MVVAADGFFGGLERLLRIRTWPIIRNLSLFLLVVFWLAVGYWVYKDARRRIEDPWLVAMATVLGLVPPFVGAFIYMLFRPPEYLEDVRERELEIKAMEERLGTGASSTAPSAARRSTRTSSSARSARPAQAGLRDLQGAPRAALAGVPVLRDADLDADGDPVPAAVEAAEKQAGSE